MIDHIMSGLLVVLGVLCAVFGLTVLWHADHHPECADMRGSIVQLVDCTMR